MLKWGLKSALKSAWKYQKYALNDHKTKLQAKYQNCQMSGKVSNVKNAVKSVSEPSK